MSESGLAVIDLAENLRPYCLGWLHPGYRLGQFDEAVAALVLADENHVKKYGRGIPPDVAYLAMAHHQLDNEAEARAALERCRELIQLQGEDQFEKDNLQYLAEAEQLIEPGGDGASSREE